MHFDGLTAADAASAASLALVQGVTVALPRRLPGRPARSWWWVLPPAAFAALVLLFDWEPGTAVAVAAGALVVVPALAALALARLIHGARPAFALAVPLLLVASLAWRDHLSGEVATVALAALSCAAIGAVLARVADPRRLLAGAAVLAAADVALMATGDIHAATGALFQASAHGLPRFSDVVLGTFSMGYGDMFIAGIAGGIAARCGAGQGRVAILTALLVMAEAALFAAHGPYPATVPVVAALVLDAVWRHRPRRRVRARLATTPPPRRPLLAPEVGGRVH